MTIKNREGDKLSSGESGIIWLGVSFGCTTQIQKKHLNTGHRTLISNFFFIIN
jgi:hypothetical protein